MTIYSKEGIGIGRLEKSSHSRLKMPRKVRKAVKKHPVEHQK